MTEVVSIAQPEVHVVSVSAVGRNGEQGPQGIQGVPGTPGADGDKTYVHSQGVAQATWVINHNLNKYPSVSVVDSGGSEVVGNVDYTSLNTVTLSFSASFAGTAHLN